MDTPSHKPFQFCTVCNRSINSKREYFKHTLTEYYLNNMHDDDDNIIFKAEAKVEAKTKKLIYLMRKTDLYIHEKIIVYIVKKN